MGKPIDEYQVGQIVISKRGKDAGRTYVIVGFLGENRLALADADRFNVDSPKVKNPKHVRSTSHVMTEVVVWVETGKSINRGEFCRFLENALGGNRNGEAG